MSIVNYLIRAQWYQLHCSPGAIIIDAFGFASEIARLS